LWRSDGAQREGTSSNRRTAGAATRRDPRAVVVTAMTVASSDWRERALCSEVDPDLFFRTSGGASFAAKRLCLACPVRVECLDFAMRTPVEGVWGGTSTTERQARARSAGIEYRTDAMTDKQVRESRVAGLHARGLNDTEIAERTGLATDTVLRIRHRLGLPSNAKSVMPPAALRSNRARRQRAKTAAATAAGGQGALA
jgi:WhiB family redox-sensing transcriptional regulator